jgi:acyl-CoA thioesterase-1
MRAAFLALFILLVSGFVLVSAAEKKRDPEQSSDKYWYEDGKPPTFMNMKILFFTDGVMNGYGLPDEKLSIQNQIVKQSHRIKLKTVPIFKSISADGMTTAMAVTKVKQIIEMRPHLLILCIGVNDAIKNNDVDIVHNNLTMLLTELQRAGIYVMLVGVQATPQMGGYQYMSSFNSIYAKLASQFNLPFMPYVLENIAGNPLKFQNNNIYPNADGAKDVADNFVIRYLYKIAMNVDDAVFAQYGKYRMMKYREKKNRNKRVIIKED